MTTAHEKFASIADYQQNRILRGFPRSGEIICRDEVGSFVRVLFVAMRPE